MSSATPAIQRLRAWISDQPSKAAAARLIGCDSSYLTHLLKEGSVRRPGLDIAFRIERLTASWEDGPIKASEWLTSEDDEAESAGLPATGTEG